MPIEQTARPPLVGRVDELEAISGEIGLLTEATDGSAAAVLLAGDAGVGKTRLLGELRHEAEQAGWRVAVGHCLDFGDSALPYLPFTELFGSIARDEPETAQELISAQPALARLMPGHRMIERSDPGAATTDAGHLGRGDLFDAVHASLSQLAQTAPLLVLLEDLHWADQSTRELLTFLFTRPPAGPVSLVASYRSDDLHRRHPLRSAVAEWSRLPGVSRVTLGPLGEADVRALVRQLHPDPLPEPDLLRIVSRADGNAFFTEELVAAADQGGRMIPTDLADLLLVRLDRLGDASRQLVRAASVAGRRVSHDLLARVAGMSGDDVDAALRPAVEGNVLVAIRDRYAFRHALLAEAVYDDLLPGERTRWHAAYVAALTAPGAHSTAAELAHHARSAHNLPVALRASITAGDEAMSVGGPDEAITHYEAALELLGEPSAAEGADDLDQTELTIRAAGAAAAAGRIHRALTLLQHQLAELPDSTSDRTRAELLEAIAQTALLADTGLNVLEITTRALDLLPDDDRTPVSARLANSHALANLARHRIEDAQRWLDHATELGAALGLADVVADAATTRANIERRAGDPEGSRQALITTIRDAHEAGELTAELRGMFSLASLNFELGELAEARELFATAHRLAVSGGRTWAPYGGDSRMMEAIVAYTQGDWAAVRSLCDTTADRPPPIVQVVFTAIDLSISAGRGDHEAVAALEQLRPAWAMDPLVAILAAAAAIDLHGDAGDLDEAVAVHDDAVELVSGIWDGRTFQARIRLAALLIGQFAHAASHSAASERAGVLARAEALTVDAHTAAEIGREHGRHGLEGVAWLARADAELARLRWLSSIDVPEGELLELWAAAVDGFAEFGHVFEVARSRARLAVALRAAGRPQDATRELRLARESALALGAAPLLAELRLAGAGSGPAGSGTRADTGAPVQLTAREHEVLALVAQGRSNGEIGRQLFISTKTVSVHVSNILAKLGAAGRTEAAAMARRLGLLTD